MAFIDVKIYEPELSFGIQKLYQNHMSPEHKISFLEYIKCINKIGYICNQDIILIIAYAMAELQIIYPLKDCVSTISYGSVIQFAQEWLKSPSIQKYNPYIMCRGLIRDSQYYGFFEYLDVVHSLKTLRHSSYQNTLEYIDFVKKIGPRYTQVCELLPVSYCKTFVINAQPIVEQSPGCIIEHHNIYHLECSYILGIVIDDSQLSNIKSIDILIGEVLCSLNLTKYIKIECIDQTLSDIRKSVEPKQLGVRQDLSYTSVKMYNFDNIGVVPMWNEVNIKFVCNDVVNLSSVYYVKAFENLNVIEKHPILDKSDGYTDFIKRSFAQ